MIRDITISAKSAGDDQYYEPPTHVLNLAVIGGDAHLAIYKHGAKERAAKPIAVRDTANVATSFPGFVALARAVGFDLAESSVTSA